LVYTPGPKSQIMIHPWFTTSLPAQATTMNANYLKVRSSSPYFKVWVSFDLP